MTNFPLRVQQAIDRGYEFDFGDYISKGISLVIKNAGLFLAYSFIFFLITFVINIIPLIGMILFYLVLAPCLGAGYLIAARRADEGRALEFSDFFKGFDHIGQLVVAAIINYLPILAITTSAVLITGFEELNLLNGTIPEFAPPLWLLLLYVPLIYIYVAWSMAPYLIIFHDMRAWPALEASRQIISKKWFYFFLLAIVAVILASMGIIVLLLGFLLTFPIIYTANYAAFRDIVGVANEQGPNLDITAHLVD